MISEVIKIFDNFLQKSSKSYNIHPNKNLIDTRTKKNAAFADLHGSVVGVCGECVASSGSFCEASLVLP